MEPDDATLIEACRTGDDRAWELLVSRYQRLVYSVPRRAGLSDDNAAEAFQRVFTVLAEQLDTLARPVRLRAWLLSTARHESWRLARRAQLRAPQPGRDDEDGRATPAPLSDEELERLERQHLMRQALAGLDGHCRDLLGLLFFHPAPPPYELLALALDTTAGSVGPARTRCLEQLHARVEQLEG